MKLEYGKHVKLWREFGFRIANSHLQDGFFIEINLWWWFVTLYIGSGRPSGL